MVVVASRRDVAPFGLEGGRMGRRGANGWSGQMGQVTVMGGRSKAELLPGDVFVIETPGGGGFGFRE